MLKTLCRVNIDGMMSLDAGIKVAYCRVLHQPDDKFNVYYAKRKVINIACPTGFPAGFHLFFGGGGELKDLKDLGGGGGGE